jgi:deazaflavin-dependent oxidoreductase (nitroreductase family)
MADFEYLADEQYCYLTTTGRVTGNPHEIEIWFGSTPGKATIYLLSGGRDRSDWVKNLTRQPSVTVRIGGQRFLGVARKVTPGTEEDAEARRLLLTKYGSSGDDLKDWGERSLPIAIELTAVPKPGQRRRRGKT